MSEIAYPRFRDLYTKVRTGEASKAEEDEYVHMMYQEGKINKKRYHAYKRNQDIDFVIKLALVGGIGIILGSLIKK